MTAPVLAYKKFYVVNPFEQYNYIKNPTFAHPDFVEDWTAYGAGVTIEETGDEQRFGAYSMKVNTASGVDSGAYYRNLSVTNGVTYAFSCYVKGTAGRSMLIAVLNGVGSTKAITNFTTTGYWQRVETTFTAAETKTDYRVYIQMLATASTAPFYVDGCQFEHWKMTTFFDGYSPGCRWTGAPRNSTSYRSAQTGLGGELVDLEDYCKVVQVIGLGHGNWNQILTKMTSGGDMYQTHIRKSHNFSIIVDFLGNSLSEIEANRAAVIDLLRPDKLSNRKVNEQFGINMPGTTWRGHEQRVIRYQGIDVNGNEATNPVDIVCVPLPDTLTDTPDLPTYQRAILNFTIPSGLLQGAYNEGTELDLDADFPAEYIVKRDANGNWVKWGGAAYESLITGLNGPVYCMAEGPDGKIYVGGAFTNAGGVSAADYLARWDPISEAWEAVVSGINGVVRCMDFDANGDLYIGGSFTTINSGGVGKMAKVVDLTGTPSVEAWGGAGIGAGNVLSIVVTPNGIYIGGSFTSVDSIANTARIARWNGAAWEALSTGLNNGVNTIVYSPDNNLYIGGNFTDAAYPYLCKWNGTAFSAVGTNTDINGAVYPLAFDETGKLYVGGNFTNAGGIAAEKGANYIACWNGSSWSAVGKGADALVYCIAINGGKLYASGKFTSVGDLTLTDRVAVWSNGAWQPLDIDLPGSDEIFSILPASDGSLYIGGTFSTAASSENATCAIVSEQMFAVGVASASANTYPFIQVYGPGTLKSITNYTTGKSVMFDGLTLQAGEWIGLNFDPLNLKFRGGWDGRGNLMRYVIPGSDYGDFYLVPGSNALSLYMTEATTDSGATIVWSPKFWGIDGALL